MRGKPHPNQEVSAFVEAGVFYVKTLADMASKPNAAVAVQTDWVVIQSWLFALARGAGPVSRGLEGVHRSGRRPFVEAAAYV